MTQLQNEIESPSRDTAPPLQAESRAEDDRLAYQRQRMAHWDTVAASLDQWHGLGGGYRQCLIHIYRHLVLPGSRVLEIGCAQGDLLAALAPRQGVGVDFSPAMVERAQRLHPASSLRFLCADGAALPLDGPFDAIILSDLVNDLWDIQGVLAEVRRLCHPRTRIILNFYSRLWEPILRAAQWTGLAQPRPQQNWVTTQDVTGLLHLAGLEPIRHWSEIMWPRPTPVVNALANSFLAKLWLLRHLDLANFIVARPKAGAAPHQPLPARPVVSVIVPARNEAGNIDNILRRVPALGARTELIFVEGNSTDDTYAAIELAIPKFPGQTCQLFRQTGKGKGDAVRLGFAKASGEILLILDADLTVAPEDLPRFVDALVTGQADFVNGVRLVYPMEAKAMRFLNLVANKFFGLAFSWVLGQPVKDTLCGTKVLWKQDYEIIAANRAYFGDFDPFGDFDLLFGAARCNMKIVDMPIRYRARVYGTTNISRFRHGLLLFRMLGFAARRLKFI